MVESSGSFPLGATDKLPFRMQSLDLQAGDKLLLYTDGLVERMNHAKEQAGYDRLLGWFRELAPRTPQEIVAGMFEKSAEFAQGAPATDDETILCLYRKETETSKI